MVTLDNDSPAATDSSSWRAVMAPVTAPIPDPRKKPVSVVWPLMAPVIVPTTAPPANPPPRHDHMLYTAQRTPCPLGLGDHGSMVLKNSKRDQGSIPRAKMQVKAARTALFITLNTNPFPESLVWEKTRKETASLHLKTIFSRQEKHPFILGWMEIERERRWGGRRRRVPGGKGKRGLRRVGGVGLGNVWGDFRHLKGEKKH